MAMLDPLFMDIDEVYSGDEFGLPYRDLVQEGIVAEDDFEVTAGSGNSVDVAAGAAWVEGDTNTARQPTYRCINDATLNLGISPDPSNPRKVLIIIQIKDEAFTGTGREAELQALHGTPAASPSDPTLPDSALLLATLTVPAAAADSSAYTITDGRVRAFGLGKLSGGATEGQVPVWDNTAQLWQPGTPALSIYRKLTEKDVVNTVTETDLLNGEISIAAGEMVTNKTVRCTILGDYLNNSGANRTLDLAVKLGATTLWKDTVTGTNSIGPGASRRPFRLTFEISNLGADDSQFMAGFFWLGAMGAATTGLGDFSEAVGPDTDQWGGSFAGSSAEDTSSAKALVVTATHPAANANLSVRLKSGLIEVI